MIRNVQPLPGVTATTLVLPVQRRRYWLECVAFQITDASFVPVVTCRMRGSLETVWQVFGTGPGGFDFSLGGTTAVLVQDPVTGDGTITYPAFLGGGSGTMRGFAVGSSAVVSATAGLDVAAVSMALTINLCSFPLPRVPIEPQMEIVLSSSTGSSVLIDGVVVTRLFEEDDEE